MVPRDDSPKPPVEFVGPDAVLADLEDTFEPSYHAHEISAYAGVIMGTVTIGTPAAGLWLWLCGGLGLTIGGNLHAGWLTALAVGSLIINSLGAVLFWPKASWESAFMRGFGWAAAPVLGVSALLSLWLVVASM